MEVEVGECGVVTREVMMFVLADSCYRKEPSLLVILFPDTEGSND